ncbi:hypothetical protein [Kocuria marina]|uniref:hypothetical protein n=1 Tax=Kocuria marina TaxID=223184 RepID=UPI00345F2222
MTTYSDDDLHERRESMTDILPGIRDPRAASKRERRETLTRRREPERDPVQGTFDPAHLHETHRRLYQDVWEWAGQIRTVVLDVPASFPHRDRV